MAVVGPLLVPYEYTELVPADRLVGPSADHFFGTDQLGRDVFSRVVVGSRNIFFLAGSGTLLALLLGTSVGLFSAYYGGVLDEIITRLLDAAGAVSTLVASVNLMGDGLRRVLVPGQGGRYLLCPAETARRASPVG